MSLTCPKCLGRSPNVKTNKVDAEGKVPRYKKCSLCNNKFKTFEIHSYKYDELIRYRNMHKELAALKEKIAEASLALEYS